MSLGRLVQPKSKEAIKDYQVLLDEPKSSFEKVPVAKNGGI